MDWSPSKLIRIEAGTVSVSTNDLRALLEFYGVDRRQRAELIGVARASRAQHRWSEFKDVISPEFRAFLGYESSASVIRNFEPIIVPGLLQTEAYASAVIAAVSDDPLEVGGSRSDRQRKSSGNHARVQKKLELRLLRQDEIRKSSTRTQFILDESVLYRTVGGQETMRQQLDHLLALSEVPEITITVVPFAAGRVYRMSTGYVIFEFPDHQDEDVLYLENDSGEYITRENAPTEQGGRTPATYLNHFYELERVSAGKSVQDYLKEAQNRTLR